MFEINRSLTDLELTKITLISENTNSFSKLCDYLAKEFKCLQSPFGDLEVTKFCGRVNKYCSPTDAELLLISENYRVCLSEDSTMMILYLWDEKQSNWLVELSYSDNPFILEQTFNYYRVTMKSLVDNVKEHKKAS